MTVLGGDQFAQQITMALTQAGITITGAVFTGSARSTSALLKATGRALKKAPGLGGEPQGKMSLKRLQRTSGGDLHAQDIAPELVRRLKRDLKRRGLDFSMEKGADGRTYFHFKGADVDTVRHAIAQVAAAIDRHYPDIDDQARPATEIDPESEFEEDLPAIEDHPGAAELDVDRVLDAPDEWVLDEDGIVLGETPIPEQVTLSWLSQDDLAPQITIEEAIPPSMATYLGRDSQAQVRELLEEASTRGWTGKQIYERLNSRPLPPTEKLYNPAKLIVSRVDDIAAAPPPPTPLSPVEQARQVLTSILDGTSGMDARKELLTLSGVGNDPHVVSELGDLYEAAYDAHRARFTGRSLSEPTGPDPFGDGPITPDKVRARLEHKIEHKSAARTQPAPAPIKTREHRR